MKPILLGVVKNAYLLVLIPFVISFIRKDANNRSLRFLFAYIYVCFATEAAAKVLWWLKMNNLLLLHIFSTLEFLLLSLLFRSLFKSQTLRALTVVFFAAFLIFSALNSIFIQPVYTFNSYSRFVECIFIIFYSISYFAENNAVTLAENPDKKSVFWINSGILIYFAGCFCTFVLSNYLLTTSKAANLYVWSYHTLLLGIYYCFISIGLWKTRNI